MDSPASTAQLKLSMRGNGFLPLRHREGAVPPDARMHPFPLQGIGARISHKPFSYGVFPFPPPRGSLF